MWKSISSKLVVSLTDFADKSNLELCLQGKAVRNIFPYLAFTSEQSYSWQQQQPALEPTNPLDEILPADSLTLEGVSPKTFNPLAAHLQFSLKNTEFFTGVDNEFSLTINGTVVPIGDLSIASFAVNANVVFQDGKNEIIFDAYDNVGRTLHLESEIWAGGNSQEIQLVNENGLPFIEATDITVKLSNDNEMVVSGNTTNGKLVFANFPSAYFSVEASSTGKELAIGGDLGSNRPLVLKMVDLIALSDIDNNDFSQGISGWVLGANTIATLVPHKDPIVFASTSTLKVTETQSQLSESGGYDSTVVDELEAAFRERPLTAKNKTSAAASFSTLAVPGDLDLTIRSTGNIKRRYTTEAGTSAIVLRYRFVLSCLRFNSPFNDNFSVSLKSTKTGKIASEHSSINSLGQAAFSRANETVWHTISIPTNPAGDAFELNASVADLGDGDGDGDGDGFCTSYLILDSLKAASVIPLIAWDNVKGGVTINYRVEKGPLALDVPLEIYWAKGPGTQDRMGAPIYQITLPAGTPNGTGATPLNLSGSLFADAPSAVTHIIFVADNSTVAAIKDVNIDFGPDAVKAYLAPVLRNMTINSARVAGQGKIYISRTLVTAEGQARAMFNNLAGNSDITTIAAIQLAIVEQLGIYALPGEKVINYFKSITIDQGMTVNEIKASAKAIKEAMTAKIIELGAVNVSKHCESPLDYSVIDVPWSIFSPTNGILYKNSMANLGAINLSENKVYHSEVKLR